MLLYRHYVELSTKVHQVLPTLHDRSRTHTALDVWCFTVPYGRPALAVQGSSTVRAGDRRPGEPGLGLF